jgi:hypothetical protein
MSEFSVSLGSAAEIATEAPVPRGGLPVPLAGELVPAQFEDQVQVVPQRVAIH